MMEFSADQIAYKEYKKFLQRRAGQCRIISVGPKYTKIDQGGLSSAISINQPIRDAKEETPEMETTSDENRQ